MKKDYELMVAELSALYELSSILFLHSKEEILKAAKEKAIRLFGVRYFLLYDYNRGKTEVVASWGFRTPEDISLKISQRESNQFHFPFRKLGNVQLFVEQTYPIENREHRLYLMFVKNLENALLNSRNLERRIEAEEALKESESKYRKIFENVQDIFYQTDLQGLIVEISPSIFRYSGFTREELIGKPVETVYSNPEDRKKLLQAIAEKGEIVDYELKLKIKDNTLLYVSTNAHVWLDEDNNPIGIEGSLRDITERKSMELQLEKSLEEKELLLKEIHHRVKNNLMIISSLLDLQSQYISDKESKGIFIESQNRARSMAIIHEMLYQSTDLKNIDFGDYIRTLSNELFRTYTDGSGRVELEINVDDVYLDINTTIPLGLIVNELVTNSLKYAFPEGKSGQIKIDFHSKDEQYEFTVKDNGIGLPEDLDYQNTDSLGLKMVTSLTNQIDGELKLDKTEGTTFKITLKETEIT